MGAFLEKPKTDKITDKGEAHGIKYGVSAMQGWRMEMEDAHVCCTNLPYEGCSFFGVFDGHAGPKVSQYCSTKLVECIVECIDKEMKKNKHTEANVKDMVDGIRAGFLKMDADLKKEPQWANAEDRGGTTAITVMVTPKHVIWGNCGDSRGLLVRSDEVKFATEDHKPYNEKERKRIEKAGGTVMMQRVNGSLAVSRALGDFDYKRSSELDPIDQLVSPEPEVTALERDPETDQFLLLACDGIYDVMSNDDVMKYVLHHLQLCDDLAQICSTLIDTCLHKNSKDNMSVVLVTFPSAPKVSLEAIEEDKKLQEKAMVAIKEKIQQIVDNAQDPLDTEENHVMMLLNESLEPEFDVSGKRPFVNEILTPLRKEKFGNYENDNDFSGFHDPADAPDEIAVSVGDSNFIISPHVDLPLSSSDEKHSTSSSEKTSSEQDNSVTNTEPNSQVK